LSYTSVGNLAGRARRAVAWGIATRWV